MKCPPGCVVDPRVPRRNCPEGKVLNPLTKRCIKDRKTQPKVCPEGKVLIPVTKRCIKDPAAAKQPKVCPEGKVLSPVTKRCITARQPRKNPKKTKSLSSHTYQNNLVEIMKTRHAQYIKYNTKFKGQGGLHTYMDKIFKLAQTNLPFYQNIRNVEPILELYYVCLGIARSGIPIMEIAFDDKISQQGLGLRPVLFYEQLYFFKGALAKIIRTKKSGLIYLPLSIRYSEDAHHANILVVDVSIKSVHRLEPNGIITGDKLKRVDMVVNSSINDECEKQNYTYYGEVFNFSICKNVFGLQARLGGGFCRLYAIFQMFLLIQMNQRDVSAFLMVGRAGKESYMFLVDHMTKPQLLFVFAHFLEKVFHIFQASDMFQNSGLQNEIHYHKMNLIRKNPQLIPYVRNVFRNRKKVLPLANIVSPK